MGLGRQRRSAGCLHPDIVSNDKAHQWEDSISSIVQYDLHVEPDMLLVIGTRPSIPLKLTKYIQEFSCKVHSQGGIVVWISNEKPAAARWKKVFDHLVLGDVHKWAICAAQHWRRTCPGDWDDDCKIDPRILAHYTLAEDISRDCLVETQSITPSFASNSNNNPSLPPSSAPHTLTLDISKHMY